MDASDPERRLSQRKEILLAATVEGHNPARREEVQARDVSLGGVCFEDSTRSFELSSVITITLAGWPAEVAPLMGEVVHTCEHVGRPRLCGVRFAKLGPAQRQLLLTRFYDGHDPATVGGPQLLQALFAVGQKHESEFCAAYPHPFLLLKPRHLAAPQVTPRERVYLVRSLSRAGVWHSISVGRDPTCDVSLDDQRVSRHHAVFERDPRSGDCLLLDKGSQNGTRVDGRRLPPMQPRRLTSGAVIDFAGLEFWFFSASDVFKLMTTNSSPETEALWNR